MAYPPNVPPIPPAPLGFVNFETVLGLGTNYVRWTQCLDCGALVANHVAHKEFHDRLNNKSAILEVHIAELRAQDRRDSQDVRANSEWDWDNPVDRQERPKWFNA